MGRRLRMAPAVLALLVSLLATSAGAEPFHGEMPLGRPNLAETRTTVVVAPGVTHIRIVRGEASKQDGYFVDIAFLATRGPAHELLRDLRTKGFKAQIELIEERAPDDPQRGPLGYLVRVGRFSSEAEATAARGRLAAAGYTGLRVVYSGEDGGRTTGPWVVNVLEIAPRCI